MQLRKTLGLLLTAGLLLVGAGGGRPARGAAAERPNVVVILADDLGWGDPRCYNPDSKIPTPVIDRLAREGMRFTDAHAPTALCTPSRYALLTGRYCWRSKLKRGVLDGYSPALIELGRPTLASFLKEKGYATACIGKWHLGMGESGRTDYAKRLQPGPTTVGFDTYFGIPASLDMPPYLYIQNDGPLEPATGTIGDSQMRRYGGEGFWRAGAIAPGFRHQDVLPRLTDRAVEWVRKQTPERPFFLYFALNAPHTPWMPTPEFRGKSGADWYGDYTVETDAMVGRVVDALKEKGLARNTLLFFASDNGAHWLPTDIQKWNHRANGPWRGQKSDIWEAGHRVPFIAAWPGHVQPGSTCDQTVCHADIFATVAEVLGERLPENGAEDSFSMRPLLQGHTERPVRASLVNHSGDGLFGIRVGQLKLVEGLGSGGFTPPKTIAPKPGGPEGQLYDLAADPAEQHNLWLERPADVSRLKAALEKVRTEGRSRPH